MRLPAAAAATKTYAAQAAQSNKSLSAKKIPLKQMI